MSEQTQDWKTERITEYARLEARKHAWKKNVGDTTFLKNLRGELENARIKLDEAEKPYNEKIDAIAQQQAGIKLELIDRWYGEEKTFECTAGTATLRTTKSLKIQNKQKLIDFLVLNKKLVDFIKTFEIAKLRKIKDAGFLGDEVVSYDETKSIAIKIAELKQ
jgi:hypothetical protein